MQRAEGWFICRTGFVETFRAVGIAAGRGATRVVREEWPSFGVVEVDQALAEQAASFALDHDLRSLDSLHLAAAMLLRGNDLMFSTWDRRLHAAARSEGLQLIPDEIG